jgi:hypothetical protein
MMQDIQRYESRSSQEVKRGIVRERQQKKLLKDLSLREDMLKDFIKGTSKSC